MEEKLLNLFKLKPKERAIGCFVGLPYVIDGCWTEKGKFIRDNFDRGFKQTYYFYNFFDVIANEMKILKLTYRHNTFVVQERLKYKEPLTIFVLSSPRVQFKLGLHRVQLTEEQKLQVRKQILRNIEEIALNWLEKYAVSEQDAEKSKSLNSKQETLAYIKNRVKMKNFYKDSYNSRFASKESNYKAYKKRAQREFERHLNDIAKGKEGIE
jgi:hypothetical protein